jgi:hypothetical protein
LSVLYINIVHMRIFTVTSSSASLGQVGAARVFQDSQIAIGYEFLVNVRDIDLPMQCRDNHGLYLLDVSFAKRAAATRPGAWL